MEDAEVDHGIRQNYFKAISSFLLGLHFNNGIAYWQCMECLLEKLEVSLYLTY